MTGRGKVKNKYDSAERIEGKRLVYKETINKAGD
jgi:hypothetical protein